MEIEKEIEIRNFQDMLWTYPESINDDIEKAITNPAFIELEV